MAQVINYCTVLSWKNTVQIKLVLYDQYQFQQILYEMTNVGWGGDNSNY